MRKAIIFIMLLGLCGCIFVRQNYNVPLLEGLKAGMSKEEVSAHMGSPASTKTIELKMETYEAWRYPVEERLLGKYKAVPTSYYEVLFSGDKVVRWDRMKVISQPAYEYKESDSAGEPVTQIEIFRTKPVQQEQ
ncbi:hypothetical protein ACFL38_02515 [Candidatus Omnitrophota bacterium]